MLVVDYAYDAYNQLVYKRTDKPFEEGENSTVFVHDNGQVVLQFDKAGSGSIAADGLSHRWRPEEVAAIVEYCRANPKVAWIGDVVVGLACTGLRISELAAMRWGDVDLQQRILSLPDESGYADRQDLEPRDRKSGRSRSFPIHSDLIAVLIRQRRTDAYVFRGPRGGRLKPDYVRNVLVNKVINKLVKQFPSPNGARGFSDGRLHSFRHYFCSLCANGSVPIMMVMAWLGHNDSAMVRHYYHLHDAESRRHMDRLVPLGTAAKSSTG